MKGKLGILASGRGSNAEAIMTNIEKGVLDAEIAVVLSDRPDVPVLEIGRRHNVKAIYLDPGPKKTFLVPEVEAQWVKVLKEHEIDLLILAGFMRILKKTMLDAFAGKILNIHPALLPAFPGLEVQKKALEYGVKFAGCTVHFVDETVDGGPIITQAVVPVLDNDSPETLAARILKEEHRIYTEAIALILSGNYRIEGRRVIRTT